MSHGRHNASSEVAHLVADVRRMSKEDAYQIHGIEIRTDGSVYDSTDDRRFRNLNEWASYVISLEGDEWEDEYDRHSNKWEDYED